jgi:RNA methyltransferase, TrmH family
VIGTRLPASHLKKYRSLAEKKGRLSAGAFVIEGPRALRQLAKQHPDHLMEIITSDTIPSDLSDFPARVIPDRQFRSLSRDRSPQGILAIVRLPEKVYSDDLPQPAGPRILLLEDIQDPGNLGTLIRTAAAFDFSGVLLSDGCADPFSPKAVQSTAGSVLSLWIRRTSQYNHMVDRLRKLGYRLATADVRGRSDSSELRGGGPMILALANEASGPSDWLAQASDIRFRIPVNSKKAESLNVAVCGAIGMFLSSGSPG